MMKKTKWIAGLLSFMMILSSLCVLPVTASAAEAGDTATEAQLMDGMMAEPAVSLDFDEGYTGISDPNKADLQTDFSYVESLGYRQLRSKEDKTNKHVFLERA